MSAAPHASPRLDRAALDAWRFSPSQLDTLFAAILVDDDIDEDLRVPEEIEADQSPQRLAECFALCRRLWIEGFDADVLRRLATTAIRDRDFDASDRGVFKAVRAKFKHLRYAHAIIGSAHVYPPLFDHVAATMGHLQDAYRNKRDVATVVRGLHLRALLVKPLVARLHAENDRFDPATPQSFRGLLKEDYAALAAVIARPTVTGHVFHATRKRVGRQLCFWDTLRTLEPTEVRFRLSRWLAAINGSMGALHDRLVERRIKDRSSYAARFVLPDDIRERMAALVALANRQGLA